MAAAFRRLLTESFWSRPRLASAKTIKSSSAPDLLKTLIPSKTPSANLSQDFFKTLNSSRNPFAKILTPPRTPPSYIPPRFPQWRPICGILAFGSFLVVWVIEKTIMVVHLVRDGVIKTVDFVKDASMPLLTLLQVVPNEPPSEVSNPSMQLAQAESAPSNVELEEIAKEMRKKLEELLKKKGMQKGSYSHYRVFVKDQKVMIGVQVPPTCDIQDLIGDIQSLKLFRGWKKYLMSLVDQNRGVETDKEDQDFRIVFSPTLTSRDKIEMRFVKEGSFNDSELDDIIDALDDIIDALQIASVKLGPIAEFIRKIRNFGSITLSSSMQEMGIKLYGQNDKISWDNIAGYDKQKREIEDTVLLALQSPYISDYIARGTRNKFETNRARTILFEGPPGTGKTTSARVIANQAGVPLLYVPLEIIMSKSSYECKYLVEKVFSLANRLPTGVVIFLDGIDSLAGGRDDYMDFVKRGTLSELLRQIDGIEQDKKVVVIAATNRKEDLHPTLMSRIDTTIYFGLPDEQNRLKIAAKFAKHLRKHELIEFAPSVKGMSGRDIRDVCQQAERSWASKMIGGEADKGIDGKEPLPPLHEYTVSAKNKQKSLRNAAS